MDFFEKEKIENARMHAVEIGDRYGILPIHFVICEQFKLEEEIKHIHVWMRKLLVDLHIQFVDTPMGYGMQ